MKKLILLAVFLSVSALSQLSAQQAATEGKLLRWKFEEGAKYGVEVQQEMRQQAVVSGENMNLRNDVTTTMTWVVLSIDADGIASIGQTIDRVQMNTNGPQGEFEYDSNNKEHEPEAAHVAPVFDSMVGVEIRLSMNDRGEILDVVYPAESAQTTNSSPLGGQLASPEAMRDMTTKASPVLPEGPAVVGQTWSKGGTSDTPLGAVSITNTYTYEGKSPDDPALDLISVDMKMAFDVTNSPIAASLEIQNQDNQGMLVFDVENGYLSSSEIQQNMELAVSAAGQEFEQKIESSTKMNVTPAN